MSLSYIGTPSSSRMDQSYEETLPLKPLQERAQDKQLSIKKLVEENLSLVRKQERRDTLTQARKEARQEKITQLRELSAKKQKKERVMVLLKKRDGSTRYEGSSKGVGEKEKGEVASIGSKKVRQASAAQEAPLAHDGSLERIEQSIVALSELATKLQNEGIMDYYGMPQEWVAIRVRSYRIVVANKLGAILVNFREKAVGDNYAFAFETAEKAINSAIVKLNELGRNGIQKLKQLRAKNGLGT